MKCDECDETADFLIPVKVVDAKEVRDLRLCPKCFEIYTNPDHERHPIFSQISYPHFFEGSCKACNCETRYLREVTLNFANEHRDILLCPDCYKSLRFLMESGDLRDSPVFISV
jgi:protein-arginine kinase activator protein McsA